METVRGLFVVMGALSMFGCSGKSGGEDSGGASGVGGSACSDEILGAATGSAVASGSSDGWTNDYEPCGGDFAFLSGTDTVFHWTAPSSGLFTIDTYGSDFDTVLTVLPEGCSGAYLECNDDWDGPQAALVITAVEGTGYEIVLDSFSALDSGNYVLNIRAGEVLPAVDSGWGWDSGARLGAHRVSGAALPLSLGTGLMVVFVVAALRSRQDDE